MNRPPEMFDPGLGPHHLGHALVEETGRGRAWWDTWWSVPGLVVTEREGPDASREWRLIPWVRVANLQWHT